MFRTPPRLEPGPLSRTACDALNQTLADLCALLGAFHVAPPLNCTQDSRTGISVWLDTVEAAAAGHQVLDTSITSNQNNYDWQNYDHVVFNTSSTTSTITGLLAPTQGTVHGRRLRLTNGTATGVALSLAHESASSTAANRIRVSQLVANQQDVLKYLYQDESLDLIYDSNVSRWVVVSCEYQNDLFRERWLRRHTSFGGF